MNPFTFNVEIKGYNSNTFTYTGTLLINDSITNGIPKQLVSWSENKLAYITDSAQVVIIEPGGIGFEENNVDFEWSLYPNPVTDYLNIVYPKTSINEITIYSSNGTLAYYENQSSLPKRLNLIHFQPGLYIVKIRSDNFILFKKFIKY